MVSVVRLSQSYHGMWDEGPSPELCLAGILNCQTESERASVRRACCAHTILMTGNTDRCKTTLITANNWPCELSHFLSVPKWE